MHVCVREIKFGVSSWECWQSISLITDKNEPLWILSHLRNPWITIPLVHIAFSHSDNFSSSINALSCRGIELSVKWHIKNSFKCSHCVNRDFKSKAVQKLRFERHAPTEGQRLQLNSFSLKVVSFKRQSCKLKRSNLNFLIPQICLSTHAVFGEKERNNVFGITYTEVEQVI